MSSCATSAAQDRMNAAPTIASPKSSASTPWDRCGSDQRSQRAGTAASRARPKTSRTLRSAGAACGGVVIACGDPSSPESMLIHMDWVLLVVSLLVILAGSELFTNGVEWVGEGFGLSEGAVGSVLAAVGTALPETILPIIAIASGHAPGEEIGVGAILGAPFMLTTLAMVVIAVAILIFARGGRRSRDLDIDRGVIRQDLGYFLVMYALAVVAGLLHVKADRLRARDRARGGLRLLRPPPFPDPGRRRRGRRDGDRDQPSVRVGMAPPGEPPAAGVVGRRVDRGAVRAGGDRARADRARAPRSSSAP